MSDEILSEILQELRRQRVDGLWTIDDIAAYLGYHYEHTRSSIVCKTGFPKPIKIGRNRRWEPDDVRAWAAKRKVA